jgi:hypothetical protein
MSGYTEYTPMEIDTMKIITRTLCLSLTMALVACGDNATSTGNPSQAITPTKTLEADVGGSVNALASSLLPPAGLEAMREGSGIRLRWMPGTDTAVSYRVYWSEQQNVSTDSPYTDVYEATYLHDGLIPGMTYHYRVSTLRGNEESALSTTLIVPATTNQRVGSDAAE